jgi:hypothetical protein
MKSQARVAVIGGGVAGCSVLDPRHLDLDRLLAGVAIQDVLEGLADANADQRHHYCPVSR